MVHLMLVLSLETSKWLTFLSWRYLHQVSDWQRIL